MRQLWWACANGHEGCVLGKLRSSKPQLGRTLVKIEREHLKKYTLCPSDYLRIAPNKKGLSGDSKAGLTWKIDHERTHLNLEQRMNAIIQAPAPPALITP